MKDFIFDDNFDKILSTLENGAKDACNDTVDAIVETAAGDAQKRTGAMASSIYAIREGEDAKAAYTEAKKAVEAKNPLVEVEPPMSFDDYSSEGVHAAHVDVITPYAPFMHNGFDDYAGNPYLENAGNTHKQTFEQNVAKIGADLERI
jgi:hypothetical protein